METKEKILRDAIVVYNSQVNEIRKFQLNSIEMKLFFDIMEDYAKQEAIEFYH